MNGAVEARLHPLQELREIKKGGSAEYGCPLHPIAGSEK
jgi:hypothetical protein